MRKLLALVLSVIIVCSLAGCKKNNAEDQSNSANGSNTESNGTVDVDNLITGKLNSVIREIKTEDIKKAVEAVPEIKYNFVITSTNKSTVSLQDDGTYTSELEYIVKCDSVDGCKVTSAPVSLVITSRYDGGSTNPTVISMTVVYAEKPDLDIAVNWGASIISSLTNKDIANAVTNCGFGQSTKDVYSNGALSVDVEKYVDNSSDDSKSNYATLSVKIRNTNETSYSTTLENLKLLNTESGLYSTNLFSTSANLTYSQDRVSDIFGINCDAQLVSLNDASSTDKDGSITGGNGCSFNVYDKHDENALAKLSVYTSTLPDGTGTVKYVVSTFSYDNVKDLFYASEDIIKAILGFNIALDEFVTSEGEFEVSHIENDKVYDLKLTKEASNNKMSMNITIEYQL